MLDFVQQKSSKKIKKNSFIEKKLSLYFFNVIVDKTTLTTYSFPAVVTICFTH